MMNGSKPYGPSGDERTSVATPRDRPNAPHRSRRPLPRGGCLSANGSAELYSAVSQSCTLRRAFGRRPSGNHWSFEHWVLSSVMFLFQLRLSRLNRSQSSVDVFWTWPENRPPTFGWQAQTLDTNAAPDLRMAAGSGEHQLGGERPVCALRQRDAGDMALMGAPRRPRGVV